MQQKPSIAPLLFRGLRPVSTDTAVQYVGTDTELDVKGGAQRIVVGDKRDASMQREPSIAPMLFLGRRPVSPEIAAPCVGTDSELDPKDGTGAWSISGRHASRKLPHHTE